MLRLFNYMTGTGTPEPENPVLAKLKQFLKENPALDQAKKEEILKLNAVNSDLIAKQQIEDFILLAAPEEAKNTDEAVARLNSLNEKYDRSNTCIENAVYAHANNTQNPLFQQIALEMLARMAHRGSFIAAHLIRKIHLREHIKTFNELFAACTLLQSLVVRTDQDSACGDMTCFKDTPTEIQRWQYIFKNHSAKFIDNDPKTLETAKNLAEQKDHYGASQRYLAVAIDSKSVAVKIIYYNLACEQANLVAEKSGLRVLAECVHDLRKLYQENQTKMSAKQKIKEFVNPTEDAEEKNIKNAFEKWKAILDQKLKPYLDKVKEFEKACAAKRVLLEKKFEKEMATQNRLVVAARV
jgi:hypothetical protein